MKRVLTGLLLLVALFAFAGCMSTPESGQIVVVRNGGPFDNKNIRQVICPGEGNTWIGWASSTHGYPDSSSQRTYKLDNTDDADANPPLVRTKDGVNARITGTFYLKTGFDCTKQGEVLIRKFDQAFVNRPEGQRPWEDWSGWLNSTVQPIIDSNMREIISTFNCRELVSSCALVGNNVQVVNLKDEKNNENIQRVERALQEGLAAQLKSQLREDYFQDITFNLQVVELPEIDEQIAAAQAKFAEVASVRAEVEKEKAQVDKERQKKLANRQKQLGYNACKSCARQDEIGKLPQSLTTLVLGQGSTIAVGQK